MRNISALKAAAYASTAILCFSTMALAQSAPVKLHTPSQALSVSLSDIAKETGRNILFSPDVVKGMKAAKLDGTYTALQAVQHLISGKKLQVISDKNGNLVIRKRDAAQESASGLSPNGGKMEEVIVTARSGVDSQRKVDASYAISTISDTSMNLEGPTSVGEALKMVPGFWVESSGGEASANVRVRGIPNDGFSSVALEEDGMSIQHDAGLGWLNADQSMRMDSGIDHIEVVRGGPASIFASNAPGAVINFITRKASDHPEGGVKYTDSDYNYHRVDGWYSTPLGNDWGMVLSGFLRFSRGIRPSQHNQNAGGQIRANFSHHYSRGDVLLGVKWMNDRIANYDSIPMMTGADGKPKSVPGLNALTGNMDGDETDYLTLRNANGTYRFHAGLGTYVNLLQLTAKGNYKLGYDDWQVQDTARFRLSSTKRNSLTPYKVYSASTLLSAMSAYTAAYSGADKVAYEFTNHPDETFDTSNENGNGLAAINLARSHKVPESEFINDARIMGSENFLGKHDLTFGFYFAHVQEGFHVYSASVVTDVRSHARLLDIVAQDSEGNDVGSVTEKGVYSNGVEWDNAHGNSETYAIYGADEWKINSSLRIDAGVRWESISTTGLVGQSESVDLGQSDTQADTSVLQGTGEFDRFSASFDHFAYTLGVNYQFTKDSGVFARYTSTFRLPSVSDYVTDTDADPKTQTMNFIEAGYKLELNKLQFYATAFRSVYNSYGITDYQEQSDSTYKTVTDYSDTQTYGVEFEGRWQPVSWFDISADYTFQDPEFKNLKYTDSDYESHDYSGHQLLRTPKNSYRITPGVNLFDGHLRVESDISYYGKRFSDAANSVVLPSYRTYNLHARYDLDNGMFFNLYVDNLTNVIGLTQGNPRSGSLQSSEAGDSVYIARSISGRTIRAAVNYRF